MQCVCKRYASLLIACYFILQLFLARPRLNTRTIAASSLSQRFSFGSTVPSSLKCMVSSNQRFFSSSTRHLSVYFWNILPLLRSSNEAISDLSNARACAAINEFNAFAATMPDLPLAHSVVTVASLAAAAASAATSSTSFSEDSSTVSFLDMLTLAAAAPAPVGCTFAECAALISTHIDARGIGSVAFSPYIDIGSDGTDIHYQSAGLKSTVGAGTRAFRQLCESVSFRCVYAPVSRSCVGNSDPDAQIVSSAVGAELYSVFSRLNIAVAFTRGLVELARVAVVLVSLCRRSVEWRTGIAVWGACLNVERNCCASCVDWTWLPCMRMFL